MKTHILSSIVAEIEPSFYLLRMQAAIGRQMCEYGQIMDLSFELFLLEECIGKDIHMVQVVEEIPTYLAEADHPKHAQLLSDWVLLRQEVRRILKCDLFMIGNDLSTISGRVMTLPPHLYPFISLSNLHLNQTCIKVSPILYSPRLQRPIMGQMGYPKKGLRKISLLSVGRGSKVIESGYCLFQGSCQSASMLIKKELMQRPKNTKNIYISLPNQRSCLSPCVMQMEQLNLIIMVMAIPNVILSFPTNPFKALILLFLSLSLCLCELKLTSILDSDTQKVFLIQQRSNSFILTITCKQSNMLSLYISTELNHKEAPAFNIYGNMKGTPKMAHQKYTNLTHCKLSVSLNTSNFIEIRRMEYSTLLMTINEITFKHLLNRFVVVDESVKWGLGQRFQRRFDIRDGKWTIWNRDKPWKIDQGDIAKSDQTYGHHPVYLARERVTRLYHLLYFRNTHGMQIEATRDSDQLAFNSLGGSIHLILICGDKDPQKVIEQYHQFIGASHIPPFWSLGFHQSRWGYRSVDRLKEVAAEFKYHKIPLDCIWTDLDYMKRSQIFTVDELKFPPSELYNLMRNFQLHYVPLLDVAIAVEDQKAVDLGKEMRVFMMEDHQFTNTLYTGQVWPGKVYYIDYLHPNASAFWSLQLQRLNSKMNFSGIWLDMNQPTNFAGGKTYTEEPLRIQHSQSINMMTIDADLRHYSHNQDILLHREVHAYYGHLSTVPTFEYLNQTGRPFIISRSTSVGSGMFAGHWTGDNVADWDFLRLSISGNFLFQIFGIQMVGADICGFYQDTSEELCARWMQLGSFYPFARNHNHKDAVDQQPYEFGQILLETSQLSLRTRYSLLKYFYTLMVAKKGLGSIFRPLSFEFYEDQSAYQEHIIETQFLLGRGLMVAPIVQEFEVAREVYFPGQDEEWYQFSIDTKTGAVKAKDVQCFISSTMEVLGNELPAAPLTFLRGGFIIFTNRPATRSHLLSNKFHLTAALKNGTAEGEIMGINDYEHQPHIQQCISQGCFFKITITYSQQTFHLNWSYIGTSSTLGQVTISSILILHSHKKWLHLSPLSLATPTGSSELSLFLLQ